MDFAHLHVHSEYSFLDGACRLRELVDRARDFGMCALALTDHGGLHGAIEFYQLARESGIKPIIGCEVYLASGKRDQKSREDQRNYHLTLLAKNRKGYENLVQMVSRSHTEGFYHKPRVDAELLNLYSEGLIALSGCLNGEIPQLLLQESYQDAFRKSLEYQAIFGSGNFYLELQNHGLSKEIKCNRLLQELGGETGIPLVATNDVHYIYQKEVYLHELLVSIQTLKTIHDPNPLKLPTPEYYLKSAAEMETLFRENPEAIENTLKISEECNLELNLGSLCLPVFPVPEGINQDDLLINLCRKGLYSRYPSLTREIKERLDKELNIIRKMGLVSYFLIVADLVSFARKQGIAVGPGRGSGGSSLVAYVLHITDIDPIKYNLFFERFLNPERPDLPDIDLDFCQRRRDEVLSYLSRKYGSGNIAQIGIISTFGARGAIRDVGKALAVPEQVIDMVARNLPRFSGKGGLEHSLKTLPEFQKIPIKKEPFGMLVQKAKALEGRVRHSSIHAAGVVISQKNMRKLVPLQLAQGGESVTQYGPESLEALGLVKIDLLGLRNLTIIDDTLKLLVKTRGMRLTPGEIPQDDLRTYYLLQNGDTVGCFQLESSGMRSLLKKLKPANLEDLIAILALYRPGPWDSGMVGSFVKRRNREENISYLHPVLEPILKDTYGIILFQEQVMQIANSAAGFSMGEADLFRRAIAKRAKDLDDQRVKFIQGCKKSGLGKQEALKLFESLTKFAGYSFNKAHSTAYAHLSYQTAFLKANYPLEYFASLFSTQTGYYSLAVYVEEARRRGMKLLLPDINKSSSCFTVDEGSLRVGFELIKGVGIQSIYEILKERKLRGEFTSFYDFCNRVDTKLINQVVLKNLISVGAFDSLGQNRAQLLGNLEKVLKVVRKNKKARECGQLSLWDVGIIPGDIGINYKLDIQDYFEEEKNRIERELLTISVREHPLNKFKELLKKIKNLERLDRLDKFEEGNRVTVAGIIVNCRRQPTKNKEYMLFLLLEDQFSQVEVVLYPRNYQRYLYQLSPEGILVRGKVTFQGDQPKVVAESVQAVSTVAEKSLG